MRYIDRLNQVKDRFYKVTFWLVVLSTSITCIEFVWNFLIFDRPHTDYHSFTSDYYPQLGAGLCAFFLLRSRWPGVSFIMPLLMWTLSDRVMHTWPPAVYSELKSPLYTLGALADLGVWSMMFFLILLSALRFRFLRRLHQYLKKNPNATNALAEQAAVTLAASVAAETALPKMGLYLSENTSRWDTSRRVLLVTIGLMLLLSPVFSVLQWVPTAVKFSLTYKSVPGVIFYYGSVIFIPALFSVFAAVMIFKQWKSISYLIPLLTIYLWGGAFLLGVLDDAMPHELIAHTLGRYTDRALIGLILLNTLLLPIDWVKGWRAKKTAQAS